MIKIAICDDEKEFRSMIEEMVNQYIKNTDTEAQVDIFTNPSELIDATENGTI
jgi:hypothetical protein